MRNCNPDLLAPFERRPFGEWGFNFKGRLRSYFYNMDLRKGLHTHTHRRIGNSKKYKILLTFAVLKEN